MNYKTIEQARKELEAVNPDLVPKYEIKAFDNNLGQGVQLIRGQTSIVSWIGQYGSSSYGGKEGLYEIYPQKDGVGFRKRFRTSDDVTGWLSLKDAIAIAEATENNSPELEALVRQHY